jgi:inorganic pyrophosphatase/exopolyphosphatase
MGKIVVTAGERNTDIDALACAISYADLLRSEERDAISVFPGAFNKSITNKIRSWQMDYLTTCPKNVSGFVIVDMSNYNYFAEFVDKDKVLRIFDHHYGFKDYWEKKIGKNAVIEYVGSCATLIWETYKRNPVTKISQVNANLLAVAIVSNTLNFNASITNERDKNAFNQLKAYTTLDDNWIKRYFEDQTKMVYEKPYEEIKNDTNLYNLSSLGEIVIGQIELWNSGDFVTKYKKEIEEALLSLGNKNWFMTAPSISEGKNYLFTKSKDIKEVLENKIGAEFEGDIGVTGKLWLRKEILRELQ